MGKETKLPCIYFFLFSFFITVHPLLYMVYSSTPFRVWAQKIVVAFQNVTTIPCGSKKCVTFFSNWFLAKLLLGLKKINLIFFFILDKEFSICNDVSRLCLLDFLRVLFPGRECIHAANAVLQKFQFMVTILCFLLFWSHSFDESAN